MLENIRGRFESIFKVLGRNSRLTESNIRDGIREIKLALLEADVNYKVVKEFVSLLEGEALGEKVLRSVTPTEQFIKLVYDKLVYIMGGAGVGGGGGGGGGGNLVFRKGGISVILLIGLQGSGKTTTAAKLGYFLKSMRRCLLVSVDIHRPAAMEQLEVLAGQGGLDYFSGGGRDVLDICESSLSYASSEGYHVVIVDTAGRLSLDELLMSELELIKGAMSPCEVLFVSDSMAGQGIVGVASDFDSRIGITGIVLTKFDSDARGGAALSLSRVTGKEIKFIGVGEGIDSFELFHADRIASRILGKGDIVSFVEKVSASLGEEGLVSAQKKMLKNKFDMEDFLVQIRRMRKMGSLKGLVEMLPLSGSVGDTVLEERKLVSTEAIILSMTSKERRNVRILDGSRRRRVARGSGCSIQEVNALLKQFGSMQKMMKRFRKDSGFLRGFMGGNIAGDMGANMLGNIKKLKI